MPARHHKALSKGGEHVFFALSGSQDGRHDAASSTPEYSDQLSHLLAQVGIDGPGIGKMELADRAAGERVRDQGGLIGPPAVDSGFAHCRPLRHLFDCEIGESSFGQNFETGAQNGKPRFLAARASRGTLAIPIHAIPVGRRPFAHAATLPYNQAQSFRIRYAEYRI